MAICRQWRRFQSGQGKLSLKLDVQPQQCGVYSTRGIRRYNEDRFVKQKIKLGKTDAILLGVFDGHGGPKASEYVSSNLATQLQSVYSRIYDSEQSRQKDDKVTARGLHQHQSMLEQSLKETFRLLDSDFRQSQPDGSRDGTTASVAVLQSIQVPYKPSTLNPPLPSLLMTVAHLGDTRILMSDVMLGNAQVLTTDHSPTLSSERKRLEKAGGFVVADSFGHVNALGVLGVTRSIGVKFLKDKYGDEVLSCQPDIIHRSLTDKDSFLLFLTDGVMSVMSNQEAVDIVKHCKEPQSAASTLVDYAERFGTQDNCTALVFRLEGWKIDKSAGAQTTRDFTANLRKFKLKHQSSGRVSQSLSADYKDLDEDIMEELAGSMLMNKVLAEEGVDQYSVDHIRSQLNPSDALKSAKNFKEVPITRFVLELFDAADKDAGDLDEDQSPSTGDLSKLSRDEVKDCVHSLGVVFKRYNKSDNGSTSQSSSPQKLQQQKKLVEIAPEDFISQLPFQGQLISAPSLMDYLQKSQIRILIKDASKITNTDNIAS
ncbi:hypothetical protein MP228_000269 [Amoeboaphelidium protococcarum]|nr:hypothetical protein MP228_000269 [Amoeboaphelidium protococcarum]